MLRRIKQDKRGMAQYLLLAMIVLFTAAIVLFITHYFVNETISKFRDFGLNDSLPAKRTMNMGVAATGTLDVVVILFFLAMVVGMIIYAVFVPTHPIFLVSFILVLALCILVAIPLSNGYEKLGDTATLEATSAAFPMTEHIMDNLPLYTLLIGAVGIIIMFAKRKAIGYSGAGVE